MNSISDVWQSVLSRLQEQLSETTIRTWFDEVDVVTMEDSAFVLHCSNSFKKSTIETRFMKLIKAALKDIFSSDLEVKILNDEQLAAYHGVAPDQPGSLLDSDAFTFETYAVGPQNKLAYAAARAVADKPAENFNPLFIYGDSGLGKTHLLNAIPHQDKRKRKDLRGQPCQLQTRVGVRRSGGQRLMGRQRRRHQNDAVQPKSALELRCSQQMAAMRRVEAPAEYTDICHVRRSPFR